MMKLNGQFITLALHRISFHIFWARQGEHGFKKLALAAQQAAVDIVECISSLFMFNTITDHGRKYSAP